MIDYKEGKAYILHSKIKSLKNIYVYALVTHADETSTDVRFYTSSTIDTKVDFKNKIKVEHDGNNADMAETILTHYCENICSWLGCQETDEVPNPQNTDIHIKNMIIAYIDSICEDGFEVTAFYSDIEDGSIDIQYWAGVHLGTIKLQATSRFIRSNVRIEAEDNVRDIVLHRINMEKDDLTVLWFMFVHNLKKTESSSILDDFEDEYYEDDYIAEDDEEDNTQGYVSTVFGDIGG